VASGIVVAGVMGFVTDSALQNKQMQHTLAISQKDQVIANLSDEKSELEDLNAALLAKDEERAAFTNFVSLHSRAVTYAVVNHDRCLPYVQSLGNLLRGSVWDVATLESQYKGAIQTLVDRGYAEHRVTRAGPAFLDYKDGGGWPIVELWQCEQN
jgi:hypothetical protein